MTEEEEDFFNVMGDGWRTFFAENGIKLVAYNLGWSQSQQKWYGWSNRAIYGFGVGSTVEPGHCAYVADTPEGLIEDRARFFGDLGTEHENLDRAQQARDECQILPDRSGIRVLHTPMVLPMASSFEDAIEHLEAGTEPEAQIIGEDAVSIIKCGRGTWTAKTLEDAKRMALDFAKGVA